MQTAEKMGRCIAQAPWTLGLSAAIVALNWGTIAGAQAFTEELLSISQFDRDAILAGELWRLITGSLAHWSWQHLALDVGAFLAIGLLFERAIGSRYPLYLFAAALAVGAGIFLFAPEVSLYRGLSGVDSGQFALAVLVEIRASGSARRLLLAVAAGGLFAFKLLHECVSGGLLFNTDALGDIGAPLPLSHLAGTIGGLAAFAALTSFRRERQRPAGEVRCEPA